MFRLGFIVNPIAGIGGSVALKGSDGEGIAAQALLLGAVAKANDRAKLALEILQPYQQQLTVVTVNGAMGEDTAKALGFSVELAYQTKQQVTTATDTENAVKALSTQRIDLLLFAGGDGTARNICRMVGDSMPVLGIPAGCKIHSGVYAITPKSAGRVVELMITNQLVSLTEADVMDIDESLFRQGVVKPNAMVKCKFLQSFVMCRRLSRAVKNQTN
jgi:predicted polyphosphate/ATP-dependent NAD kinase